MQIVKLDLNDIDELYKIYIEEFKNESWTKKQIIDSFNNNAISFYGIKIDNKIVCFASILETVDDINLLDIATSQAHKRKGYAKTLLKYLIGLKAQGQSFSLEVKETNNPAINLYSMLGFKTLNIRKKYYKDGSNALCMFLY